MINPAEETWARTAQALSALDWIFGGARHRERDQYRHRYIYIYIYI